MCALDAAGIGVEGRIEGALGGREIPQDEVQGLGEHAEVLRTSTVLPRVQIGAGQLGLVGEHLLEVGHKPPRIGRVAAESADEMVVDAAGCHGIERAQAHVPGLGRVAPAAAGSAQAQLDEAGPGNFGAGPKPPHSGSKPAATPATTCSTRASASSTASAGTPASRSTAAAPPAPPPPPRLLTQGLGQAELSLQRAHQGIGLLEHLCPLVVPGVAQRLYDAAERRHPVALDRWEVGAGIEGAPVGGAEDRHRPAPGPSQGLGGRHVDGVEVGTLLAVDLDRNEGLTQVGGGVGILEALVRHDVAPVARGVADGDEEGLVLVTARRRASSPQGNHSTGFSACWRRYGLVSSARWFT